jgi:D-lactate dehydrogenase
MHRDKPFIENATHGKLEIEYTNQALNEDETSRRF